MEAVTSPRNPRVRAAAALARRRRRRETGRHLVEGPHAVGEALAAGVVETLFVLDGHDPALPVPADTEVVPVTDHVLTQLADTTTPQGVVAVARDVTVALEDVPADGAVVVLDGVADPGNVGGILRTAHAAGMAALLCTRGTADPLGPKAVRAAAGSTYHLPLVTEAEPGVLGDALRARGRLLGLEPRAGRSVLALGGAERPLALVLGSEAHGLGAALADRLDDTVAVPMWGTAESLNVAAAAAVAIYAVAGAQRAGDAARARGGPAGA